MRKQLTLFLLLLCGIGLLLARQWWLPPLLAQIPQIEERSNLIQAVEALVSLLVLAGNVGLGYLLWLARQEERKPEELLPLAFTSADAIREGLGQWGGRVNWIDRGTTRPGDLRRHPRLALIGPSRIGKTREAAELIRRAVDDDLIPAARVCEPSRYFRFIGAEGLASAIQRQIAPQQPLLFFIDDLPYHFYGAGLEQLSAALAGLGRDKELYVIAALRADQTTDEHRAWLNSHGFHVAELAPLTPEQSGRQVDGAAGLFGLRISDAARRLFVERSRGVPELALVGLRRLREEQTVEVGGEDAARVMQESVGEAWARARREIEAKQPAARHLLDSLGVFYAAGVLAYEPLLLRYAARQARPARFRKTWQVFTLQRRLRAALTHLALFDIRTREGIVRFPDEVANDGPEAEEARQRLGAFLEGHRRLFHNRYLRRLHREREAQRWACFDLALGYQNRQEHGMAIRYYSLGLAIDPHPWLHNNRGNAHAALGEQQAAIQDYDRAIQLDPQLAIAYNNRGNARRALGEQQAAIADYDRAIQLDPQCVAAFYNRGNARYALGEHRAAIADYDRAIQLDPQLAIAYGNRGNVRADLGEHLAAISDYDRAIQLNPQDAVAFYNRGRAHAALSEQRAAIQDFDRAIQLFPDGKDKAVAWNNRGVAHADLGEHRAAITDFDRAIQLNPEYAAAYGNRGTARRSLGEHLAAISDYDRAIQLFPDGKDKATAYNNRGTARRSLGEHLAAIQDYDRAIQLDPQDATAYGNRGLVRADLGEHLAAIQDYDRAIQLFPDGADKARTYRNKALILRQLERYDEAANAYRQALASEPTSLVAWMGLAELARRRGDTEEWREAVEQARPLLDEEKDVYNAACFYSIAGEVERALELLAKAIASGDGDAQWAKQDPDLSWIRDDPRFWEIVGEANGE